MGEAVITLVAHNRTRALVASHHLLEYQVLVVSTGLSGFVNPDFANLRNASPYLGQHVCWTWSSKSLHGLNTTQNYSILLVIKFLKQDQQILVGCRFY